VNGTAATTPWWVYIVRCADGTFYTGIARDPARRVAEHNAGGRLGARYTRARRPVALVYSEPAATRSVAGRREYAIKQLARSDKQALIAGAKRGARSTARPPARRRPARVAGVAA
jgi:putative endonuclease